MLVEKRAGLVGGEDRRLALFDDIFWAAHGVGRIDVDDVAGDEPVEQHAYRGQVLLGGRGRDLGLKVLDEGGDMERLHRCEFIDAFAGASSGEAPGGVQIGPAGMVIVNLPCEEFQDALSGFWCGCEEWRRLEIRRGRENDFGNGAMAAPGGKF
jgi:hypothetical protein